MASSAEICSLGILWGPLLDIQLGRDHNLKSTKKKKLIKLHDVDSQLAQLPSNNNAVAWVDINTHGDTTHNIRCCTIPFASKRVFVSS